MHIHNHQLIQKKKKFWISHRFSNCIEENKINFIKDQFVMIDP